MRLRRLAAAALLLCATPAAATEFCGLRPTSDGFVALRAQPSAKARIVARMRVGDEVLIQQGARGPWVEVLWWRGATRLTRGFHTGRRGWAAQALIDDLCG